MQILLWKEQHKNSVNTVLSCMGGILTSENQTPVWNRSIPFVWILITILIVIRLSQWKSDYLVCFSCASLNRVFTTVWEPHGRNKWTAKTNNVLVQAGTHRPISAQGKWTCPQKFLFFPLGVSVCARTERSWQSRASAVSDSHET